MTANVTVYVANDVTNDAITNNIEVNVTAKEAVYPSFDVAVIVTMDVTAYIAIGLTVYVSSNVTANAIVSVKSNVTAMAIVSVKINATAKISINVTVYVATNGTQLVILQTACIH